MPKPKRVGVREEFDHWFSGKYPKGNKPPFPSPNFQAALSGAQWMAEKIARESGEKFVTPWDVHQLAKELSDGK